MEAQRQQLFKQWEAKLSKAQEATEAANAAHTADKEAVEAAASQALAAAAGEIASHPSSVPSMPCLLLPTGTTQLLQRKSSILACACWQNREFEGTRSGSGVLILESSQSLMSDTLQRPGSTPQNWIGSCMR